MNYFTIAYATIIGFFTFFQLILTGYSSSELLLALNIFLLRFLFFYNINLSKSLISIMVLVFIDFSLILNPLFNFQFESINERKFIFSLGTILQFIHIIITIFFEILTKEKIEHISYFSSISLNKINGFSSLYIISFFFSVFLNDQLNIFSLGGGSTVKLPFKLGSAIFYYQAVIAPFIFFIFLDMYFQKNEKNKIITLTFFYVILNIYSSFVMLSKGNFMFLAFYGTFWLVYRKIFGLKYLIVFTLPLILVLSIYDSISIYRNIYGNFDLNNFRNVASIYTRDNSSIDILKRMYDRLFKDGDMILKALNYNRGKVFFNNIASVRNSGGPSKYHTFVIDGFPKTVQHSSGSSGFGGAFMIGGVSFCILTLIIISSFGNICDHKKLGYISKTVSGRTLISSFVLLMLIGGLWQYLMGRLLGILVYPFIFYLHNILMKISTDLKAEV